MHTGYDNTVNVAVYPSCGCGKQGMQGRETVGTRRLMALLWYAYSHGVGPGFGIRFRLLPPRSCWQLSSHFFDARKIGVKDKIAGLTLEEISDFCERPGSDKILCAYDSPEVTISGNMSIPKQIACPNTQPNPIVFSPTMRVWQNCHG